MYMSSDNTALPSKDPKDYISKDVIYMITDGKYKGRMLIIQEIIPQYPQTRSNVYLVLIVPRGNDPCIYAVTEKDLIKLIDKNKLAIYDDFRDSDQPKR